MKHSCTYLSLHSSVIVGNRNLEQPISIKFCTKIGKNATETLQLLQVVCGKNAMKKSSVLSSIRVSEMAEKM